MQIKVQTPAKINLTLEVVGIREDSFHEIRSIMQAVSLYDYLTIETEDLKAEENIIELSGNCELIPYDKNNLTYKAADLFLQKANISGKKIKIYLEKNIPVAAGLAGGSSDAAGTMKGLNKLFDDILSKKELDEIAARLGSDINFCLCGGTQTASSRGEILNKISTPDLNIAIIKPKNLFISAKEAYQKWDLLFKNKAINNAEFKEMKAAIEENSPTKIAELLKNSLEDAILPDYPEVEEIKKYLMKKGCINAVMSGSGPSVFGIFSASSEAIDFGDAKTEWECFNVKTIS